MNSEFWYFNARCIYFCPVLHVKCLGKYKCLIGIWILWQLVINCMKKEVWLGSSTQLISWRMDDEWEYSFQFSTNECMIDRGEVVFYRNGMGSFVLAHVPYLYWLCNCYNYWAICLFSVSFPKRFLKNVQYHNFLESHLSYRSITLVQTRLILEL